MGLLNRASLDSFNAQLSTFAEDFDHRLSSLQKSLKYPSITNASSYRKCVQDLQSRLNFVDTVLHDIAGCKDGCDDDDDDVVVEEYVRKVDGILKGIDLGIQREVGRAPSAEKHVLSSHRIQQSSVGVSSPVDTQDGSSPEDCWSPSMEQLVGKYGTGQLHAQSPAFAAVLRQEPENMLEADEHLAMKYADDENTLELKSQVIFNRRSASIGAIARPEPIQELDDIGPTPRKVIDDQKLEDAISVALAKCDVKGVTPHVSSSGSQYPSSAPRTANTPKVPTVLPPYHPVDDSSYASLPSFIRGQITLDDLNQASSRMHALVANRHAQEEGITFCSADVDTQANLGPGKSKVFLNALAKLDRIQLKVIYGQGTVYFFV